MCTSDTHSIVATWLGLFINLSAFLKLQRRPIVDQQCNGFACIHICLLVKLQLRSPYPELKQPFHFCSDHLVPYYHFHHKYCIVGNFRWCKILLKFWRKFYGFYFRIWPASLDMSWRHKVIDCASQLAIYLSRKFLWIVETWQIKHLIWLKRWWGATTPTKTSRLLFLEKNCRAREK